MAIDIDPAVRAFGQVEPMQDDAGLQPDEVNGYPDGIDDDELGCPGVDDPSRRPVRLAQTAADLNKTVCGEGDRGGGSGREDSR